MKIKLTQIKTQDELLKYPHNSYIVAKDITGEWVTAIISYDNILDVDAVLLYKDNLKAKESRIKIGKYYAELNIIPMIEKIKYPLNNVYIYTKDEYTHELFNHFLTIGKGVIVRPLKKDGKWYYLNNFGQHLFLSEKYYNMLFRHGCDIKRADKTPKKYSDVVLWTHTLIGKKISNKNI